MRASAWSTAAFVTLVASVAQAGDPAPKPVDIKDIRADLQVFTDAEGGVYIAKPGADARVWYGVPRAKNVYEQVVIGRSSDGQTGRWDVSVWAPRVDNVQPGSVGRRADGTHFRYCGEDHIIELTPVTGDKAKQVIDKMKFFSTAMVRRPHMLARDDSGIYYYVDVLRKDFGGKGYRVFVGKKGAMKQRPLADIATDSAGDVYSTKTGDLRMVRDNGVADGKPSVTWVKGEKRTTLVNLDVDVNSKLIFKDLGIYGFTGSICENY